MFSCVLDAFWGKVEQPVVTAEAIFKATFNAKFVHLQKPQYPSWGGILDRAGILQVGSTLVI